MFRNLDSLPSEKGHPKSWSLVDKDKKDKNTKWTKKDHLMLVSWPVNSPPTLLCSLKREKHHEGEQLGNHFVDNDGDVVDVDEGLPEEGSP